MNFRSRFGSLFAIFEGVALKGLGHVTLNNIFMFSVDRRNPAPVDVFIYEARGPGRFFIRTGSPDFFQQWTDALFHDREPLLGSFLTILEYTAGTSPNIEVYHHLQPSKGCQLNPKGW